MVTWTFEQANQLRQLWHEDVLSASEIGKVMGFTKNAILGKARRLNLPNKWHRMSEPKKKIKPLPKAKKQPVEKPVEIFRSYNVRLADMKKGMCYYPVTDNPTLYCGCPTLNDYCNHHFRIMRPK